MSNTTVSTTLRVDVAAVTLEHFDAALASAAQAEADLLTDDGWVATVERIDADPTGAVITITLSPVGTDSDRWDVTETILYSAETVADIVNAALAYNLTEAGEMTMFGRTTPVLTDTDPSVALRVAREFHIQRPDHRNVLTANLAGTVVCTWENHRTAQAQYRATADAEDATDLVVTTDGRATVVQAGRL